MVTRRVILLAAVLTLGSCGGSSTGPLAGTTSVDPLTASTILTAPTSTSNPTTTVAPSTTTTRPHVGKSPIVSVALVGDVMLGRGIRSIVRNEPTGVFEDVRHILAGADIAAANLESPLTLRPHIATNPFALEADPAAAGSLATAGFDVLGIANNHAGDAGRLSILDTIEAVQAAGMGTVGGGAQLDDALALKGFERQGLSIGFLAFDATLAGTRATAGDAGIASWDEEQVKAAITSARPRVDLLIVGVHGGMEGRQLW